MPVYKLTPQELGHRDWIASTWKNEVIIRAPSDEIARAAASLAFGIGNKSTLIQWTPVNPWRQSVLVSVELITDPAWKTDGPVEILAPPNENEVLVGIDWSSF